MLYAACCCKNCCFGVEVVALCIVVVATVAGSALGIDRNYRGIPVAVADCKIVAVLAAVSAVAVAAVVAAAAVAAGVVFAEVWLVRGNGELFPLEPGAG